MTHSDSQLDRLAPFALGLPEADPDGSVASHLAEGCEACAGELRELRETVRKMLKENGEPPKDGKWTDIAVLEPVRDYKARHASTLLTFDAVVDAIGQIEGKRRPMAG